MNAETVKARAFLVPAGGTMRAPKASLDTQCVIAFSNVSDLNCASTLIPKHFAIASNTPSLDGSSFVRP